MNSHLPRLLVPLLLLAGSLPLEAAEKRLPVTNRELVENERNEFETADAEMNAAYQRLLAILDDTGKTALKNAQRKWLAWRDAQAEFDAHQLQGGKLWEMERQGSLAETTKARTARLRADYQRFK